MWTYEKRLQCPVNIKQTNPKLAQIIISQFGGPDGELAASMRYLSQRYSTPYKEVAGVLTDIGTDDAKISQIKKYMEQKFYLAKN
jgi:spore coat protein JC